MRLKSRLSVLVLLAGSIAGWEQVWAAGAAVSTANQEQNGPSRTPDVPFVPTTSELVEQMLKLAKVTRNDLVYDLGCGDGRIVIMAAQKFGAHGVGVDIDPERIKEANENARKAGTGNLVRFIQGDLFEADIHKATVVTLYLLPGVNMKLRPKLLRDLKPGTRVVSHSFDMEDWKPDKEVDVNGSRLYLWTIPANGNIKR